MSTTPSLPECTGLTAADGLLATLRRLDQLLLRTVNDAATAFGPKAAADPYRGLYIQNADIERLLSREPGSSPFQECMSQPEEMVLVSQDENSRFAILGRAFGLTPFDLDVVVIAMAPEIDLRYERLYAYLQDDVARTRPSVELALNLLCPSPIAKLKRRAHFGSNAPLIRNGCMHLVAEAGRPAPPLLAQALKLDDLVIRLLLEESGLDSRVARFCQLVVPETASNVFLPDEVWSSLTTAVAEALQNGRPLQLYFQGPHRSGAAIAAEALAGQVNASLLRFDLRRALAANIDLDSVFSVVVREARLRNAVLFIEPWEAASRVERTEANASLLNSVSHHSGITIFAGDRGWEAASALGEVLSVTIPQPVFSQRRALWQDRLREVGVALPDCDLDTLADRYRLSPVQIRDAAAVAANRARWRASLASEETLQRKANLTDLFEAARTQAGHELAAMARKVKPTHGWNDLVLTADAEAQLHEICQQVRQRRQVLDDWGFGDKHALGKGVNALFVGPPGTGKTTAAEIIALELQLDLYEIDLSRIISKYIGEMQKNLDSIFTAAEHANAILCFHEADALFSKRLETHDAHDVYVNQEIAYLLQKVEQYEGIAILTTNLRKNIDEAFTRRLQFIVEFPFPDEKERQRIWSVHLPPGSPQVGTIDYGFLAKQLRIAGGNIKNVALRAAYQASGNGGCIGMKHLLHAAQREYQKMGKVWDVNV